MYFYHHYIQKGHTMEYLLSLDFYTKNFMAASLDIVLENRNKLNDAKVMNVISH